MCRVKDNHTMSRMFIMLIITLITSLIICAYNYEPIFAKSKYRLIKSIALYDSDKALNYKETFVYNKHKDPKKITVKESMDISNRRYQTVKHNLKYKYKKGKRHSVKIIGRKHSGIFPEKTKRIYNRNGKRIKEMYLDGYDESIVFVPKKGYFIKEAYSSNTPDKWEYKYKYKGKKLKKITEYKWYGSKKGLSQKCYFNDKGLLRKRIGYLYDKPTGTTYYKYKYKNGLINCVYMYKQYTKNGKKTFDGKYIIKYSKNKTTKKRYKAMINHEVSMFDYWPNSWY